MGRMSCAQDTADVWQDIQILAKEHKCQLLEPQSAGAQGQDIFLRQTVREPLPEGWLQR